MDILVLLIMTAVIAGGGLFIASRPTRKKTRQLTRKRVLKVRRRHPVTVLKGMASKPSESTIVVTRRESLRLLELIESPPLRNKKFLQAQARLKGSQ